MSMNGIDISHWQDGINLNVILCDFVIVKATQGTKFVDPCCDKFYQAAKRAGKKLGVYHFADGKSSGTAEADHFIQNVKGYIGEAILVLDWEADALKKGVAYAKEFLDRVFEVTGVRPLIYMSKSVCREYDWSSVVATNYGLWMAQYANKERTGYKAEPWTDKKGMGAFKSCAIFQYSSAGSLPGYNGNLDLDIAYMTPAAWDRYAKPVVPEKVITYYPKYEETLVKVLQIMEINSTYDYRCKIAAANGISNYTGTAEQNIIILNMLKEGKLIRP